MGWLKEQWKHVKEYFYNENGPITAAKYYLYLYCTEYLKLREIEYDLFKLENELYKASIAYMFWFSINNIYIITKMECSQTNPQETLFNHPLMQIIVESGKVKERAYMKEKKKRGLQPHEGDHYCELVSIEAQVEYLDRKFPTLEKIRQFVLSLGEEIWFSEDIVIDFKDAPRIYEIFKNLNEYSKRMVIDIFYALEHGSGQILVHEVIDINSKEAEEMWSILDYIREGNIYALYDYLVRVRRVQLPKVIHKYSNLLPGTKFKLLHHWLE